METSNLCFKKVFLRSCVKILVESIESKLYIEFFQNNLSIVIMIQVDSFLYYISLRTFGILYGWFILIQLVIMALAITASSVYLMLHCGKIQGLME